MISFLKKTTPLLIISLLAIPNLMGQGFSPLGTWKTVDDKSGETKSHIEIYTGRDGKIYGKVVKLYQSDGDTITCYKCQPDDPRFKKRVIGMVLMKGLEQEDDTRWGEGEIMDPDNGETYGCYIEQAEADDPNKLRVRGFIKTWLTGSALGRTQYWYRVE